jgi:Na+-driven multidrug efflux pump
MCWSFLAQGIIYACTTMFQGLGNTLPSLISSTARFLAFALPALWLSTQSRLRIENVWYLLAASIVLQASLSLLLLRTELRRRLGLPSRMSVGDARSSRFAEDNRG